MKKSSFVALVLGTISGMFFAIGMCLVMVWSNFVVGIVIGLIGILLLLCLIPICVGIK